MTALTLADPAFTASTPAPPLDPETKFLAHFESLGPDERGHALLTSGSTLVPGQFGFGIQPSPVGRGNVYDYTADLALGSSALAIEASIFPTSFAGTDIGIIVGSLDPDAGLGDWYLYFDPGDQKVKLDVILESGDAPELLVDPAPVSLNTLYRYAVTRSGNIWRLYRNGLLVHTATQSGVVTYTSSLGFGVGSAPSGMPPLPFMGWLDEVRVTIGLAPYVGASYTLATGPFTS